MHSRCLSAAHPWATLSSALTLLCLGLAFATTAGAQSNGGSEFPTTHFAEGAKSASVRVGALTATIDLVRRPEEPDLDTPVLTVAIRRHRVLEAVGVASGFDFPVTNATIAELDLQNDSPEVIFTSFSGGAHCCTEVTVATSTADGWVAVPLGFFDGDGGYLSDVDKDGVAEIATYDNRFLYGFDCYACSNAPLAIMTVRGGNAVDVSREPRYLVAHRDHLTQMEENVDAAERWSSPGFLAGWVAAKTLVGEGAEAWQALEANWDFAGDPGEEVCLSGVDIAECPRSSRAVLKFPARLKLFLDQNGYAL